jgi:cytochrome b561
LTALPATARAASRAVPTARGFAAATIPETARALEQQYAAPLRYLHWLIAGGTFATFATVQLAMRSTGKQKGDYMMLHKSLGLSVLMCTAPRVFLRLSTKMPAAIPGSFLEKTAASAGHALMYVFLIGMPTTGFVMGYFGGKGLPFFGIVIPGASTPNGKLAGQAFKIHKQMGWFYELFVPLHVSAVGVHALKGQNIMRRMGVTAFG